MTGYKLSRFINSDKIFTYFTKQTKEGTYNFSFSRNIKGVISVTQSNHGKLHNRSHTTDEHPIKAERSRIMLSPGPHRCVAEK